MAGNIITKGITCVLTAALVISGFMLEKKMNEYRIEQQKKVETSLEMRSGRSVDFRKLKKVNKDAKAWLYLPDSPMDYPVLQAEDNDYYLHRDIYGNEIFEGSLFIDATNENPFQDRNTVVYGHYMYSGSMFSCLEKYSDKKYFDRHKVIQLTTEDGEYDIHVIAYCNEPAYSELYSTAFDEEDLGEGSYTVEDFLEQIRSKAKVLSKEPFDENDTYVTLSACAYNYDEARHQVIGIIREPGLVEKTHITEDPGRLNKWLLAQIGLGILIAFVLIIPFVRLRKERSCD